MATDANAVRRRAMIVDDHPLMRVGLRSVLLGIDPDLCVEEASTVAQATALANTTPTFDVIFLDMYLPDLSREAAFKAIKSAFDASAIIVFSAEEDVDLIVKCLHGGAVGYVPKRTAEGVMSNAIKLALENGGVYVPPILLEKMAGPAASAGNDNAPNAPRPSFSRREQEVLHFILKASNNKTIMRELNMAEGTVKAHVARIYEKLGVNSRAEAVVLAQRHGLLDHLSRPTGQE